MGSENTAYICLDHFHMECRRVFLLTRLNIFVKMKCKESVSNCQIIHMYISVLRRATCMCIHGAKKKKLKQSQFGCKLFKIFACGRTIEIYVCTCLIYCHFDLHSTCTFRYIFVFYLFPKFCSMHLTIVFPNSESFRTNEIVSNVAWSFKNAAFGPCFRQQWSRTLTGSHKQVYTTRSISKCNQSKLP